MKIQDSDFYALLPEPFKSVETRCISYALSMAVKRLCTVAGNARVLADIDSLDENILDYLAVELRAPYYDQAMNREEKANIVKSTLPWYTQAGTIGAIVKLIHTVYGDGEISEWFDYEGQPYHFRAAISSTGNDFSSENFFQTLLAVINAAKNQRSILDAAEIFCNIAYDNLIFAGCSIQQNNLINSAVSNFTAVIGSSSFDAETENAVSGGTFDSPSAEIFDCGHF